MAVMTKVIHQGVLATKLLKDMKFEGSTLCLHTYVLFLITHSLQGNKLVQNSNKVIYDIFLDKKTYL